MNDLLAADGALEADELNPALLNQRASRRFTGGDGAPTQPTGERFVQEPTLRLIKLAKEAVYDLFQMHRHEVQRSCGTLLDQEEALGYLISDALALEILPEEARASGKRAVLLLKKAKEADHKLKNNASARRTKARKAADKDDSLAALLDERLAAIDAECAVQRATHWSTVVERAQLQLPSTPLAPVRHRDPDRAPPCAPPATPLETAEQELAAAQAAQAAADLRARQASRALAKLQPPGFKGEKLTSQSWRYFHFLPLDTPEEELQRRKALQDALLAAEQELGRAELGAKIAERDVRMAQEQVTMEREFEERERAREREAAASERAFREQMVSLRLEREREAAEAEAEAEAAEARIREAEDAELEQLKERLRKERALLEFEMRESQREVALAVALEPQ